MREGGKVDKGREGRKKVLFGRGGGRREGKVRVFYNKVPSEDKGLIRKKNFCKKV